MTFRYYLEKAPNSLKIEEQQCGNGKEIKFSNFDSCLGIVALNTHHDGVIGIHLVLYGKLKDDHGAMKKEHNGDPSVATFSKNDVATVVSMMDAMGYDPKTVQFLGHLDEWSSFDSHLPLADQAYRHLKEVLAPLKLAKQEHRGAYDVKVKSKALDVNFTNAK